MANGVAVVVREKLRNGNHAHNVVWCGPTTVTLRYRNVGSLAAARHLANEVAEDPTFGLMVEN